MRLFERSGGVPAEVLERAGLPRGERPLAKAPSSDGSWVIGTRRLLVLVPTEDAPRRIPWEQVEDAAWDKDASRLTVTEIGSYGEQRPAYSFDMDDPALLLQLVRERVTASIVLQRRVVVHGKQGLLVIARRPPSGRGAVTWAYELDAGLDPDDPVVRDLAQGGLRAAAEELGMI